MAMKEWIGHPRQRHMASIRSGKVGASVSDKKFKIFFVPLVCVMCTIHVCTSCAKGKKKKYDFLR